MNIIEIPIKEILQDFFFCFTSNRDISKLEHSIRVSGIRTPVHVRLMNTHYQLISGFSRVRAASGLDVKKIPAILIDNNQPLQRGALKIQLILRFHFLSRYTPHNLVL